MLSRASACVALVFAYGCTPAPPPEPPQQLVDANYIIFAPNTESGLTSPVMLGGDRRPALVAPVPAEFRYRIQVPPRARLTFAIGIANEPDATGDEALPGRRMRFTIRAGDDAPDEVVFDRSIHVARRGQWIEQEVDLRRFEGREVWLALGTSFPGASFEVAEDALPIVGVFAEPVLHDRASYRHGRGVVLISIDTLRRDHTSLYGYPRRTTPGLEALAEQSIVFDDAVSTSSWTLPAHASLLTSTYPSVHGAVNLRLGLAPDWPNLAKILQSDGFRTQAIVTHLYLDKQYGFGEGFDGHQYLPEARAEQVTDRAIRFLTAMGDRDFFLFVHYYDPHWHYDPPAPYDETFDPSYEGGATGVWWEFKDYDPDSVSERDLRHIKALYDGEILYTDRHVERLMHEMKRLDVFDKSLIVVTSDHGEEFLEHGSWEHQKTLYEEQLRIPLLVKLPESREHGRVPSQVSLIDVAPTILAEMELETPATFQGQSLVGPLTDDRELWAETEHTLDGSHKASLRLGADDDKAIFRRDGETLDVRVFDLSRDPEELDPEARDAARYESLLREFLSSSEKMREGATASPSVDLDEEELSRLRALGYIP